MADQKSQQTPWTGILGAAVFLGYVLAYLSFKLQVNALGGPPVEKCLSLLPFVMAPATLPRDYFDVLGCLALAFQAMVTWELLQSRGERWVTAIICAGNCGATWLVAGNSTWLWEDRTVEFLHWPWTSFEAIAGMQFLLLAVVLIGGIMRRVIHQEYGPPSLPGKCLRTAFLRWASGAVLFLVIVLMIQRMPFSWWQDHPFGTITWIYLFQLYVIFGFPYALATNYLFHDSAGNRSDIGFIALLTLRRIWRRFFGKNPRPLWAFLRHRTILLLVRDYTVKLYFGSVMVIFLFEGWKCLNMNVVIPFLRGQEDLSLMDFQVLLCTSFLVTDIALGTLGYFGSSRWLGNKSSSVDDTLSGWAVAILCYLPLAPIVQDFFFSLPDGGKVLNVEFSSWKQIGSTLGTQTRETFRLFGLLGEAAALGMFLWATASFGLRFSNLTNRGIITGGPYAYIRHPHYVSKNIVFWCNFPWLSFSIRDFGFILYLAGIYYLRAITEERHLSRDPAYRDYCRKVRYKFIPGVW